MNEIEEKNVREAMEWASKIITNNYNRVKSLREFIRERGLIEEYWEWTKKGEQND